MCATEPAASAGPFAADALSCWRGRLVHRKHAARGGSVRLPDFSIRLEHAGRGAYFPLGTRLPDLAARRAATLDRELQRDGWSSMLARHPREITLAIFWSREPVACTYTTLVTAPSGLSSSRRMSVDRAHGRVRIGIVEPDEIVRETLRDWVAGIPFCTPMIVTGDARDLLAPGNSRRCDLVLHNRVTGGPDPGTVAERLGQTASGLPVFEYGVFEDSDAIFQSLSGADLGYFLRRRAPEALLEPIGLQRPTRPLAAGDLERHIQAYFQGLFRDRPSDIPGAGGPILTSRERQILECVRSGCHDKQIADLLAIQPSTVHTHLKKIFDKLGVRTRTEAVLRYLEK